jgi:hypothetical protein
MDYLNRIRLSANYTSEETIELCDVEVFGENKGRGIRVNIAQFTNQLF